MEVKVKIIISPAKVQNGSFKLDRPFEPLLFEKKSHQLRNMLADYSMTDMGHLMKIKDKLLKTTYELYQEPQDSFHAINLYNGIVFKEINANLYDDFQLAFMNEHLVVLSAMYGILTPLTGIKPYRLDMTMKPDKMNLYDFWSEDIQNYFKDELIINLASVEFSSMIQSSMVNIHFKERVDDVYKIVTVRAKKARGLMVDFIVSNMITNVDDIKLFCEAGYCYYEDLSDENNLVFVME